jgi:hypothetical protein
LLASLRTSWVSTSLAVLVLALTFIVLRTETSVGLFLKFLISRLVYSTSDAAALFMLGFAGMALICRSLKVSGNWAIAAPVMVWGGMLLGYGAHLAATVAYHLEHGIPFSAHVYHWSEGVNSYTALLHSHLGKSAITLALGTFPDKSNYDTGSALASSVPLLQTWLIGLSFLTALAGSLLWMPVFHTRVGRRPALTAAYLVAAATTIKSIFDGGVLAYSVPPSLLLMGSFYLSTDEAAWLNSWRRRGWFIGIALLVGYVFLCFRLTPEGGVPLFGPWLLFVVVLFLLSTTAWHGVAAWSCRGLLVAYLGVNLALDYNDNLAPLLQKIEATHRAVRWDASGHGIPQPLEPWFGKRVFQVYRELGDDPWKPRTTLLWEVPARGLNTFSGSLRLLSWQGDRGEIAAAPELRITQLSTKGTDWLDIGISAGASEELPPVFLFGTGNALSKNNYYVWLYRIDLLLRNSGWRSYILLPHTVGNVPAG